MTVFGNLGGGDQVDAALLKALTDWMPTYLKAVAEDRGIDTLEKPRSVVAVSEFARFPEAQLPAIVVENGGTAAPVGKPGGYDAKWPIRICVEVMADTEVNARRNAQLYLVAARECLLRERSLGHGFKGTDWGGERYDDVADAEKRRSKAGASATFTIERERVAQIGGGPEQPDDDPYSEYPEVDTANVVVHKDN